VNKSVPSFGSKIGLRSNPVGEGGEVWNGCHEALLTKGERKKRGPELPPSKDPINKSGQDGGEREVEGSSKLKKDYGPERRWGVDRFTLVSLYRKGAVENCRAQKTGERRDRLGSLLWGSGGRDDSA